MADFYKGELHNQTLARAIVGLFVAFYCFLLLFVVK